MTTIGGNQKKPVYADGSVLRQLIQDEIEAVRRERRSLCAVPEHRTIHILVLVFCVLVNGAFFWYRADYIALFVAASIYLNMFYFVSLLIPTNPSGLGTMKPDLPRFLAWLREIGLISATSRFTRLFMNAFFLNSRALTGGICLLFSVDIVYSLIAYFTMGIPLATILVVVFQAVIIIAFYLLVWKIEPFSIKFVKNIEQVKNRMSREKIPSWFIAALFFMGFLILFLLFMTTIILLPGITVSMFLSGSGLSEIGYLVALLATLGLSQYFIVRYVHGKSSRALTGRILEYKEASLKLLRDPAGLKDPGQTSAYEKQVETTTVLLESKIFQIQKKSILGFFPVYVITLDFSVMLDSSTLTAIKGYIHDKP